MIMLCQNSCWYEEGLCLFDNPREQSIGELELRLWEPQEDCPLLDEDVVLQENYRQEFVRYITRVQDLGTILSM